jgi:Icc-related predicted phosphoesterase
MRILALGDFHGKFPEKLEKEARKADLIISTGDFADTSESRSLEFRYWDQLKKKGQTLEKIIGKEKYKGLLKHAINYSNKVLEKLSLLNQNIIAIYGNADFIDKEVKKYGLKGIEYQCNKYGIRLLKNRLIKINGMYLAGFSGYRSVRLKGLIKTEEKKSKINKINRRWNKDLNYLFKRINPEKTIVIAHDSIKNYFDKVNNKASPMNKKHIGDEYLYRYIRKNQPLAYIGGHMHEYQGIKRLGKTAVIAAGPAYENKAVLIDIEGQKIKSIKFLK